jgi:hypothetical protein
MEEDPYLDQEIEAALAPEPWEMEPGPPQGYGEYDDEDYGEYDEDYGEYDDDYGEDEDEYGRRRMRMRPQRRRRRRMRKAMGLPVRSRQEIMQKRRGRRQRRRERWQDQQPQQGALSPEDVAYLQSQQQRQVRPPPEREPGYMTQEEKQAHMQRQFESVIPGGKLKFGGYGAEPQPQQHVTVQEPRTTFSESMSMGAGLGIGFLAVGLAAALVGTALTKG